MRILGVNFFPAFHPPRSGGEQRYYYLYHHLSRWHDVTLLSPTYSNHSAETVCFSSSFREHRVPKDTIFDRLHWTLGAAGIGPECSGYVVALAAARDTAYGREFEALVGSADVVIHDSPFTLPYDRSIDSDGKPRIYNAYNVEHRLAAQLFRGEAGAKAVDFIRTLEQSLVNSATLVFATSPEESYLLRADFGLEPARVVLAPNGFEPSSTTIVGHQIDDRHAYAVFMGSAHPPNVEAANFIVETLAPSFSGVEFRIMGAVCAHLADRLPPNVTALGFIDEDNKRLQLSRCAAALNPVFTGGGTNLKMLDYMASGAPIVTTPVGARGLSLIDRVDAFISEKEHFADVLRAVLRDPSRALATGTRAQRKAYAEFTWQSIAEGVNRALTSIAQRESARQKILVVNDFPVAEGKGGGQVRIRELLTEVGREFDIRLLCLSQLPHRVATQLSPHVLEISIPKTAEHREAESRAGRNEAVSVNDVLAADFCTTNSEFVREFSRHAATSDIVVFEHPYLQPLTQLVPSHVPIVYSSLNIESDLKAELLQHRRDGSKHISRVVELERWMIERSDMIVCVSQNDGDRVRREYRSKRIEVVENGVRTDERVVSTPPVGGVQRRASGRPLAVFVGSSHMPNIVAARFLIERVAPRLPDVTFGLIGSVCDAVRLTVRSPNVALFGLLPEQEKNAVLARATLAVNPLFEGGGSSLKVPDFFAAGLPMVSTRVGVRGYDIRDGEHYIAAEAEEFVEKIDALVASPETLRRLAASARKYAVEALDWRTIGARYRRALRSLARKHSKLRLLVVTYRFADPPPGGAESFLLNMLKELASLGKFDIDVATCDVATISNHWHFSAKYTAPAASDADPPPYIRRINRFPVDAPATDDFSDCVRLFAMWMSESRLQGFEQVDECRLPMLLGGWNFPERSADGVVRWSSRESHVFVGDDIAAVRLSGFAPSATNLTVRNGSVANRRAVKGRFDIEFDGNFDAPTLTIEVDEVHQHATNDPRELGVLVNAISIRASDGWKTLDLRDDYELLARKRNPQHWVESLMRTTARRDPEIDRLFVKVRGPHSSGLLRWLDEHIASYDVVLAQGVPFATPVEVVDFANRYGVPAVLLPHFHVEDRYYHWRSYYDAFRRSERVIAAPRLAKRFFFDPLGVNSVLAPGGGIDPSEFRDSTREAFRRAFRSVHRGEHPFLLVLGRKAEGKNYRIAIDALRVLNRDGHRVDIVMIGPDDDGIPVTASHVHCYGAQPREVVLGALSLALCLVNMSDSESFGIVLLEGWASGAPVVAQRKCVAFSELVSDGDNGFLAETVEEVAFAVEAYLSQPGLAARHADRGRQLCDEYSWAHLARQIEAILLDCAPCTKNALWQEAESMEVQRPPTESGATEIGAAARRVA